MRELAKNRTGSKTGSALLIVLGFLSFMIISSVSFSIYMRTERQASSNYRHSVTARHLLNAGLARAMEEVDSELRLRSNDELKFPYWTGRTLASALPDTSDDVQERSGARVLCIEALSFLPPFLINDVRRYAVRDASTSDKPYRGAKWRSLESSVFGRYAYVCVNVSDMFDINQCRAAQRDATTNRVSLGHLFKTDALRKAFDDQAEKAMQYFSLQDFYAVRYEKSKTETSSPYHDYLKNGNMTAFENSDLLDQMFIADGIAKPEPVKADACNIYLNQPIAPALLRTRRPQPDALVFATDKGKKPFWEAIRKMPRITASSAASEQLLSAMIKDYIDEDNVPSLLNAPCVEMVPMISQIVFDKELFKPKIVTETREVGDPPKSVTVYRVQLFGAPKAAGDATDVRGSIEIELVWPFKYANDRVTKPSFDVEVEAYLKLNKSHSEQNTLSFDSKSECIKLNQLSATQPNFWNTTINSDADCYQGATVALTAPKDSVTLDIIDSDGNKYNGAGGKISVSLIVFARVKCSGDIVDSVPQFLPYPGIRPDSVEFAVTPKLFFQTGGWDVNAAMAPQDYEWSSLEVADPRFNYSASNWVKNNETPANYLGKNPSTKKLLDTLEGRDADIFMSVSDAGDLQSPGELGFIVRPFNWIPDNSAWDFRNETEPKDKDEMFRTFRLYDHGGGSQRDDIYNHFYVMRGDGTLPGARVNPLSDIPEVVAAAIWDTPLNYWYASTNCPLSLASRRKQTFNRSSYHFNTPDPDPDDATWTKFRDKWADALENVETDINKYWSKNISDYYGMWTHLKWYSEDSTRMQIFGDNGLLAKPLHEIDRKMLYSFSLDSFSDRQQLFLYFLRAEATMPSFGGGTEIGMQSLAGGRAVALVWRDPYPRGYLKDNDENNQNDTMDHDAGWYPNGNYESPWKQYPGHGSDSRYTGSHDTRVLFFKQLGQ